jgi:hypothetical protein
MKKNQLQQLTALLFIGLMLPSCIKEIEYKGDEGDPLLVLNCITESDSTFTIDMERSVFFLDANTGDNALSDCQITLENKTTGAIEVLSAGVNGTYDFAMIAESGNTYEVRASYPDFTEVSSTMTVPAVIPLLSVDTVLIPGSINSGNSLESTLTWNDPVGTNYYLVYCRWVGPFNNDPFFLRSNDIAITNVQADIDDGQKYGTFFALDDATFDGSQKSLKMEFYRPPSFDIDQFEYYLVSCSEETYRYLISSEKNLNSGNDPFTEPVKVTSNIENGLGIFGALNNSVVIKFD